ncbi:aldose 1-epimerase [Cladophialophora yegresii CBS 114405]|uniref:Aldose 1-epimerase n=1 Tax=Cladophialophora yegresii CBS 114405 TaxID=1182544 RepID=W9VWX0_9EURO|nr:aldose 1-epimerase [Cladophialophora yegresii CBS 114405]EXJ57200.1 aldose 1-epimerase [Cladophialophora yegresii CBS 114405]
MWSPLYVLASLLILPSFCQNSSNTSVPTGAYPFSVYTLTAENITAKLIPYGARLTSLLVQDRNGTYQDVVVGYDNATQYLTDTETNHTYFGPIVGRYANRIKNSTFTLNGQSYHIPANENAGADTLHGGTVGYDQRNWTVVASSPSSITFSLLDTGFQGFPGTVLTTATYTLGSAASGPQGEMRPRLTSSMVSTALDQDTPIMLANHIYWNLNAFKQATILNDTTLWMPYSDRYIVVDPILIPTGALGSVTNVSALNFLTPKLIGDAVADAAGVCGAGCTGIDNAFILDRPASAGVAASDFPVLRLWSATTGIQLDVSTNQRGLQIYSCNGQNGTIPVKASQQTRNSGTQGAARFVNKYGCIVIETQAWIDGINHPEWGISDDEIFGPTTGPAVNFATYDFSTF